MLLKDFKDSILNLLEDDDPIKQYCLKNSESLVKLANKRLRYTEGK